MTDSSESASVERSVPQVVRTFEHEFGGVADLFEVCLLSDNKKWRDRSLSLAARPGVYVWHSGAQRRVLKVGLSLVNARARALQHIRDNTGGVMADLKAQTDVTLILFTLPEDAKHWAAALEIYLEKTLAPLVASKR